MFLDENLRLCLGASVPEEQSGMGSTTGRPLAMVYAPRQEWQALYDNEVGHERGTIFKELDFPFWGGDVHD